VAAVLLLAMAGCGGAKPLRMAIVGTPTLNADDSGAGLPVVVRIYQLSAKERMEQADFQSLWKSDREVLQEDVLDRQEFTLLPGTKTVVEIDTKKGPAYLAVMALFRKPQGSAWRQIIALKDQKVRSAEIAVRERSVDVAGLK
jgi:type VI secretion system protein VasD